MIEKSKPSANPSAWRRAGAVLGVILLLLILISLGWYLFAPQDDGTLAEIKQRGTLRVGLDASFPPFEMIDDNDQIIGLDVDIARAVAADLKVDLELVNIGFDGLYDALLARRADLIISGLPYDPRWTEDVAYSSNYFNAGQLLIVRAGETGIRAVDDLGDRTLAVEWGSQADMEGRRLERTMPDIDLVRQSTAREAVDSLLAGQADAAIVDGVSGVSAVPRGVMPVMFLSDEWYAAAVHIDSRALLDEVNRTMTRLDKSGEMAKMQAYWLHGQ